jgi:hypothetical protein
MGLFWDPDSEKNKARIGEERCDWCGKLAFLEFEVPKTFSKKIDRVCGECQREHARSMYFFKRIEK